MSLFVLGSVRRVGKLLVAVELGGELAAERFLSGVRADVNFAVFRTSECAVAVLVLKSKVVKNNSLKLLKITVK